ncbi:helix-turn-helix transcriptional regulator [Paenibacillus sp. GCM10027626]|uniref:helix-turn-helix transcriptional regulator n=1 Tax=Paenibacillus sp. GCM10027626 TaxID=3273411 RepID=UPI00362CBCE5
MNKTERMLAIVLELQRKKLVRAEDLAAAFETSIRTIYRDIQAISETGVPVVGAPGQGYSLMEGYFLPPVCFTAEEAVALLIGTDFIEQRFDAVYGVKALSSRKKIEAILPENILQEATRIRHTMRLIPGKGSVSGKEKEYLEAIRRAILQRQKLKFHYLKSIADSGSRQSIRTAAPYGLVFVKSAWTLLAWCELRKEIRHFRLSRMTELTVLEESFEAPAEFNLADYKPADDRHLTVRIVVPPDIADKVLESNNYYMEAVEKQDDGLHVILRVRRTEEVLHWVLSWGAGVVVLEPESFREQIRNEAEKMLKRY